MTLQEIAYGSQASSAVLNNNFNHLQGEITETNNNIENMQEELTARIGVVENTMSSQIDTFQIQFNEKLQEASSDIEVLQTSFNASIPDYTLFEQKENGVVYQAPCDGWLLVRCSNSNKSNCSDIYVGKTEDNLVRILRNCSNVVSHCGAIYQIRKNWYYKSVTGAYKYSRMDYGFIPFTTT